MLFHDSVGPLQEVMQYCMETLLGFLLPYGVIIGSYVCILRRIRKTCFRRRIRSEKLILVIIISFGLFWLPYHIINMVQVCVCPSNTLFLKCENNLIIIVFSHRWLLLYIQKILPLKKSEQFKNTHTRTSATLK